MSNKTIIYIAGAVSGHDLQTVAEQFRKKEEELTAQGFKVYNPVKLVLQHGYEHKSWREIMQFVLPFVCAADILYILKEWQNSKGTIVERDLCRGIGTEIRYE